ncbi:cysteine proteinase [Aspergillus homomorphus CBS 101889]|uniref:Cysteine proteinase n=1 Tax=Aspergillus homomorphus (strain CBS 101889) TaxID=1450537 RepID=A0A395IGT0_ASPHC|nr:cysteine proteinase [Aspergillus homomorphus CBS 101889]RAL17404.1 cysteine proteinase [Aspergillus homomorphus CBS 101889]
MSAPSDTPQAPDPPTTTSSPKTPIPTKSPQATIDNFWDKFITKTPGRATAIFPQSLYADLLPHVQERTPRSTTSNAAESYEAAARQCKAQVERIVRECHRVNEKFTDPEFDIENDRELGLWNCVRGLVRGEKGGEGAQLAKVNARGKRNGPRNGRRMRVKRDGRYTGTKGWDDNSSSSDSSSDEDESEEERLPGSVHRVDWIFEQPAFTIDGYSNTDIKQGANGDCWWLAAVANICNRRDLMERVCLARDEECGVYGFVFHRDGEWVSTVVDDNLYLTHEDFDFYGDRYDSTGGRAREYRKHLQTGSEALFFAKCSDPNETWLPLLEKAYAKVHGDYEALSGGWSGEAVEDMTGGVTTTITTNKVLNQNTLWRELVNAEKNFVFAASALTTGRDWTKGGLALRHAYSILRATEEEDEDGRKVRLVLVRNPWGERNTRGIGEWNGPWSDGSREWTPYWLQKLQHKFGDDGLFWMAYEDMLSTFVFLHRTRIFDETWTVVQRWTSVNVPWIEGYLRTRFLVEIHQAGPVVFVLSEVDKRYFRGLEGLYVFALHFLLQEENAAPGEHLLVVRPVQCRGNRSISAEVELEPGRYEVLLKVVATRDSGSKKLEDVVRSYVEKNPEKLKQVGMNYDLANSRVESAAKQVEGRTRKNAEVKNITRKYSQENKEPPVEDVEREVLSSPTTEEGNSKAHDAQALPSHVETSAKMDGVKSDRYDKGDDDLKEDNKKDADKDLDKDADKKDRDKEVIFIEPQPSEADETSPLPWNAVCVLGLRAYAKDPEVSIELVK